jgi:hypothetical protein
LQWAIQSVDSFSLSARSCSVAVLKGDSSTRKDMLLLPRLHPRWSTDRKHLPFPQHQLPSRHQDHLLHFIHPSPSLPRLLMRLYTHRRLWQLPLLQPLRLS